MSNIYNRRLDYEVLASGKRVLERPTKVSVPKYAVVGNTAPNLNFQVNRLLQPLTQTKKPLAQTPFVPKAPVQAAGLGGRAPYYIDYIVPERKSRKPEGLLWEPNTIREMRGNVYPDGLPKNNIPAQSADSQYIEYQNNQKKQKELEEQYQRRLRVGREDAAPKDLGRPHPNDDVEAELKRLDEMLAETKYGKGPYKNVALSAEEHAKKAQEQAEEIKKELEDLKKLGLTGKRSAPGGTEPIVALDPKDYKKYLGDPKELDTFVTGYLTDSKDDVPTSKSAESEKIRQLIVLKIFIDNGLDTTDPDVIKESEKIAKKTGQGKQLKTFTTNVVKLIPPSGSKLKPIVVPSTPKSKSKK